MATNYGIHTQHTSNPIHPFHTAGKLQHSESQIEARIDRLDDEIENLDMDSRLVWLKSGPHVYSPEFDFSVKVEAIRVPVMACGIVVRPGDCIIGDETGVVCVSVERLEEVLPIAEALAARDQDFVESLRRGESFGSAAARLRHL